MLLKVVNSHGFGKAIYKHISTANLFNYKFAIIDQLSDIIVLDIIVFSSRLALGILGEDDAGLIVSM